MNVPAVKQLLQCAEGGVGHRLWRGVVWLPGVEIWWIAQIGVTRFEVHSKDLVTIRAYLNRI